MLGNRAVFGRKGINGASVTDLLASLSAPVAEAAPEKPARPRRPRKPRATKAADTPA